MTNVLPQAIVKLGHQPRSETSESADRFTKSGDQLLLQSGGTSGIGDFDVIAGFSRGTRPAKLV